MLLAEVQLAQKHFSAAAAAYRKAGTLRPDTAAAIGEFRALRLGALEDPLGPLRRLAEQRPKDLPAHLALAQAQQELGDAPAAIRTYESALKGDPNNAAVLNNLAWLYYEARDPNALALAKRAYAVAPRDARIVDTYAWLLVENGQLPQGLALLAPVAGAGADEEVRMHYAQALARAGKREEARALGAHLASSASSKVSGEARRLLAELDRG
jgi:Tfp pilus assembly protein PilF